MTDTITETLISTQCKIEQSWAAWLWITWSQWPKHKHWNTARSKFFERSFSVWLNIFKDCHSGYLNLKIYSPIKFFQSHTFQWYKKKMGSLNSHVGYEILRSHSPKEFFIALAIRLLLKSNTARSTATATWKTSRNGHKVKYPFSNTSTRKGCRKYRCELCLTF